MSGGDPPDRSPRGSSSWRRRSLRTVILLVVLVDGLLLAGNLMFLTADEPREPIHPVFSDLRFNGDNDRSYPEIFGYLLMLANAALLVVLFRRVGAVFGVLALIVIVIAADDFFMIHERAGAFLVTRVDPFAVAGLGAQDVGEAAFWAVVVLVLAPLLARAYFRSTRPVRRSASVVVLLLAVLAFFAVAIDFLHSSLVGDVSSFIITAVTLVETFGELGAMTALAVTLTAMVLRASPALSRQTPLATT